MNIEPKDVVESYMDSLLCPGFTEAASAENTPSCSEEIKKTLIAMGQKQTTAAEFQKPSPILVKTEPLTHVIADLEDVYKLEQNRRDALQDILSRQVFTPPNRPFTDSTTHSLNTVDASDKNPHKDGGIEISEELSPSIAKALLEKTNAVSVPPKIPSARVDPRESIPPKSNPPQAPNQWCVNGRPEWAQQTFSALLFKVAGLTLAVPLVSLGQIYPITKNMTPIFGQADWFLGLQETTNGRIRAVNTALYVMPERYKPEFISSAKYVVTIVGLKWGLAVDEVQQPTQLSPDDVTWRSQRSKRPWLAGTVKSAMCALLDIPQLGYELEKAQH